ncbi:DUF4190 domain-containing protein [Mycobacterium sp.]|uniref:DUF4190 domain-containing protein n=1 Tax=Mycobacterium sp. TaxID=1785 RepID=UPI002BDBA055|nr:DUF4190 domain-containing protein [Mycobacterium sp.]HTQ18295.1 DUF4190 domain-containing protein [Mycobacterium sp.]
MTQPPAGPPYPYQPPAGSPYPPETPAGQPYPPPPSAGQYPPPYPPPPPVYGQPVAPAQTTSGFAVASLVLSLLGVSLLGLIFGIIGIVKTKSGAQRGRGMAIAGVVISIIGSVLWTTLIIIGALAPTHSTSAQNVKVGDCWADVPTENLVARVNTTSCDRPHRAEVFAVLGMPSGSFPADSVFQDFRQKCRDQLSSYSPSASDDPTTKLYFLSPSEQAWKDGDHDMACAVTFSSPRTGSVKGS